jgi:hypothetical protein
MQFAVINSNVVENVIVADQDFADLIAPNNQFVVRIDNLSPVPGIGWSYDGANFTQPEP